MQSLTIMLETIEKVRNFVNAINRIDGDFDLVTDRYVIDAKSIMGIFSLDLSKPLTLKISGADPSITLEEYQDVLSEFIVK